MTTDIQPLTGSELDELRRLAAEGSDVKLDNCELRAIVALIDRKPAKASTFGPATDDQVVGIMDRMSQGDPGTVIDAEVWQLIERIEADRIRLIDLRAALAIRLDRYQAAQAYCEEVQRRQEYKAANLGRPIHDDKVEQHRLFAVWRQAQPSDCPSGATVAPIPNETHGEGTSGHLAEIDGLPAAASAFAELSPTVAIAVMAKAIWHIIDHRVGLASLAMVQGGLLREGK